MEPYVKKGAKAGAEICQNLSKMIKANLIPDSLSYWSEVFETSDEVGAVDVVVKGFYFDGNSNLPEITAEATFKVNLKKGLTDDFLQSLQEDGETLGEAVNFFWDFVDNPIDDWDGWLINNSGIEVKVEL